MNWTNQFLLCTILCCFFSLGSADTFTPSYTCDDKNFTKFLSVDCDKCKAKADGTLDYCNATNKDQMKLNASMINKKLSDSLISTVVATYHSFIGDSSQTIWKDVDACKGSPGSNFYCPTCPMKPNEPQNVYAILDISKQQIAPAGKYSVGIYITFSNQGKPLCKCTWTIDTLNLTDKH